MQFLVFGFFEGSKRIQTGSVLIEILTAMLIYVGLSAWLLETVCLNSNEQFVRKYPLNIQGSSS